jgi:uncharacterized protein with HEPN domain
MTRHDPRIRAQHMLDHAREAVAMAQGRTRDDLDSDRQFSLAMVRLMEIIGEAAARIPEAFRDDHPAIPWQDIADLRNRLIHGYDTVNHRILWDIIQLDLPPLIDQLHTVCETST